MNTFLILALGRMAFGRCVSYKTQVINTPASHLNIRHYGSIESPNENPNIIVLELQKYYCKSDKRELTIRFAYSDKMNRLFVRTSEVTI